MYMRVLGQLGWLSQSTRYDIAYAVQELGAYLSDPSIHHMKSALHILLYLRQNPRLGPFYYTQRSGCGNCILEAWVDADWGADATSRSTGGFYMTLHGGIISWEAKRQKLVTLSTAESEYNSMVRCAKHALYTRQFLGILNFPSMLPKDDKNHTAIPSTTIYTDSQAAQAIVESMEGINVEYPTGYTRVGYLTGLTCSES
jgi:hypothetical protein